MVERLLALGVPVLAAIAVPTSPVAADLEDPMLWTLMALYGVLGSLFYNRSRLQTAKDWLDATSAGPIAAALVGLSYGLFGPLLVDKLDIVPGRMLLASAAGVLAALGVERWLKRVDKAAAGQVEKLTGPSMEVEHDE